LGCAATSLLACFLLASMVVMGIIQTNHNETVRLTLYMWKFAFAFTVVSAICHRAIDMCEEKQIYTKIK
jgi:hypothetical protein